MTENTGPFTTAIEPVSNDDDSPIGQADESPDFEPTADDTIEFEQLVLFTTD